MNKAAIKNFAIWARRELIEKVTKKAKIYGIEKDKEMKEMDTALNGQVLTSDDKKARRILIEKIDKDGFYETIEEVAYTWFNRFIAIRFMEVNGYMPSHIRVFTSENNEFEPQILSEAIHIDLPGLDKSKVLELYNAGNKEEELFNYLFITQCNALNEVLPGMFQKLNDYTELLLPDGLLRDDSVIDVMISEIPEEDWKEQVQIIGWLYQYYNEEIKDNVINVTKRKSIEKKDIPAATQIFTTDWVVRYIVDNSLGRYWVERNPDSDLKDKLEFFIMPKNGEIEYIDEKIDPRHLRILDNCVGSGHFPLYEFDVLMEIYKECGYREREAAEYILSENLYGLDIDERARQLAYFSLMMKARSYSRRILNKGIEPHIYAIPDSNNIDRKYFEIFGNSLAVEEKEEARKSIEKLLATFKDGKNYGSILKVEKVDFELCRRFIEDMDLGQIDLFTYNFDEFQKEIKNIIDVAEVMTIKYDVVATNPPYLNRMNGQLKEYVNKNYRDYKTDLFSVFMYRNFDFCKPSGYSGFMTPNVWMFLKSYEELRKFIVENKSIDSLIQIAKGAFFQEATVDVIAFVFKNSTSNNPGKYIRLEEFKGGMEVQKEKVLEAIENPHCVYFYETNTDNFLKIPGIPIAYWISQNAIDNYVKGKLVKEISSPKTGMTTADNNRFLRFWHEISITKMKDDAKSAEEALISKMKWFPYCKGGGYKRWYGYNEYVVNWENDGFEIKNNIKPNGKKAASVRNEDMYFKKIITWSTITSSIFSCRYVSNGHLFDSGGSSIKAKDNIEYLLAVLNSKIGQFYLDISNATINYQPGDIGRIPIIYSTNHIDNINKIAKNNIEISNQDWDMHETSWGFGKSPLLSNKVDGRVKTAYESYKFEVNERFTKLKENEEELNCILIGIYNLEDEVTPVVSDRDITVAKIFDDKKDIDDEIKGNKYVMTREDVVKNFLSYFIGCAMGRYSLDEEGLVFAGGEFDFSKYNSFKADKEGILPVTDQEYFKDDIVESFVKFLKVTFGEEHLNENLDFIASELKGRQSDSSRKRIRNYFLNDFYKDHCKMYQKLPIYWQYDSGKNDACRGLFYLHRYDKDMFARIRINYVFEIQDRYKQELARVEETITKSSGSQKIELQKRADELKKKIIESQQFEEKVQHIADSYIEIDLDDGVKENYKIFKDVLAKIK
ncbi:MAG: BREX-1 system adenine-specific DNA-methyltransferase PglX [Peptostreptococcus sp.]|uniref:BREX-1 system adenine-specific DNA-methyltransferase PglX n=1 Tax=Peptostreptococcus sp. TaxID=1262 RepID=UPI002FC72476